MQNTYVNKLLLFLLCLGIGGCIEPFQVDIEKQETRLVVNGLITNEPGPYTVQLNKTYQYGDFFGEIDPEVIDATVIISDELGMSEVLSQVAPGKFKTSAMQGRIGGIYQLNIRLKNGKEYVSEPEMLNPVSPIEKVYTNYVKETTFDKNEVAVDTYVAQVLIDTKDPAAEKNFYRWDWTGTYEVITQPEDYEEDDPRTHQPVKKPKPCCKQCWITKNNNYINVKDDWQINGSMLTGQRVASIPAVPEFLATRFHLEIRQYSLTETAFNFWNVVNAQSTGNGSIQDPAPANAKSNLKSVTNAQEPVYGYFGASAVVRKQYFIERKDVPVPVTPFVFPDDCRVIPGATVNKPTFW